MVGFCSAVWILGNFCSPAALRVIIRIKKSFLFSKASQNRFLHRFLQTQLLTWFLNRSHDGSRGKSKKRFKLGLRVARRHGTDQKHFKQRLRAAESHKITPKCFTTGLRVAESHGTSKKRFRMALKAAGSLWIRKKRLKMGLKVTKASRYAKNTSE